MAEIKDLSTTDASNTARFAENMAPSQVNDGARALEGMLARHNFDTVEGNLNSTGSANAYLVAANRTIAAYFDGMRQCFHANFANTGAATLNIDSVGAKTIKKNHDQDLASGDIEEHQFVEVVYSASDDTFQLLSPVANAVVAASESAAGIVELATQSEVNTGSDTARAITPAGLTGWTPAVGTVTVVSTDKLLLADASASGVLKQGLVSDIIALTTFLTIGTAQSLGSGNGVTFGSLPAGIKRVTIMFHGISIDDTDNILIQIGDSGGLHTTGYVSAIRRDGSGSTSTSGFLVGLADATATLSGHMTLTKISDHVWISSHQAVQSDGGNGSIGGGYVTLDTALTQIAILDTGGDAFDAGSINIMYEV